jgi:hypothetical protein
MNAFPQNRSAIAAKPACWVASAGVGMSVPSVDDSLGTKLLPFALSMVAGSVDIIGFLGLDGLFTAHITGNLVILAAKLAAGQQAPVSYLISVPVFMVVLALTRLFVTGLERIGIASLLPLLLLQFLLLLMFLAICLARWPRIEPDTAIMIVGGMLGVSAMAAQNEVARISLKGGALHGGDDDEHHPSRDRCRRDTIRPQSARRGATARQAHLAGNRWLPARLRPRCGMRVRLWPAVPDAAGLHCPCGARHGNRGATGSSRGKESSMSNA